jgi:hypothetical protein
LIDHGLGGDIAGAEIFGEGAGDQIAERGIVNTRPN